MNKIHTSLTAGLIILLSATMLIGCQSTPVPQQEPIPAQTPESKVEQPSTPEEEQPIDPEAEIPNETANDEDIYEEAEPPMHNSAYVKFDGIDGESQNDGHEDWSEIVSFSQAISKPIDGSVGSSRRRGDTILEDIVIVKLIDKSSPKLAEKMCKGEVFPKVEIHLTGPSECSTCKSTYFVYELKNVMITSYEVRGSNPLAYSLIAPAPDVTMPSSGPFIVQAVDAPVEELSLNFEEIKVTYTECDSSGNTMGNVEYSWKVEEGES